MNSFIEMFKNTVDTKTLLQAATVTWQGLVAIFAVMSVIAIIVFLFTSFSTKKK